MCSNFILTIGCATTSLIHPLFTLSHSFTQATTFNKLVLLLAPHCSFREHNRIITGVVGPLWPKIVHNKAADANNRPLYTHCHLVENIMIVVTSIMQPLLWSPYVPVVHMLSSLQALFCIFFLDLIIFFVNCRICVKKHNAPSGIT